MLSFSQRAESCLNPTGQKLMRLMDAKQTNLVVSADLVSKKRLLELADCVGPEICLLKTHIDIVEDFTPDLPHQLQELAEKHQFMIFEDRKFADIGNTVRLQYQEGIYRISDWADIVNAHVVPGPGIIEGLKKVGLPKRRGLLLLAEMSSKGNLCTGNYTQTAIEWAEAHAEFVMGFICRRKLSDNPGMLHMTPGVKLQSGTDALGQQYLTPEKVIRDDQSDLIIVGRGIIESEKPAETARQYRQAAWDAYSQRVMAAR